jgi:hypothetical protein
VPARAPTNLSPSSLLLRISEYLQNHKSKHIFIIIIQYFHNHHECTILGYLIIFFIFRSATVSCGVEALLRFIIHIPNLNKLSSKNIGPNIIR